MTLELQGVSAGYAGADVIHGIDLTVRAGEIVTLVGANGAGKSTLVKTISGVVPARAGTIGFAGQRIEKLATAARMRLGIVHVPEGRQIFAGLTVAENLGLGAYLHRGHPNDVAARHAAVIARFPALRDRLDALAGNLSGGQQQMLAIGRGLMAAPKLLILDEPSLGLAPRLVDEMFDLVRGLRAQGLAILLSEQNAQMSLAIADRGYVIENGRVVLSGAGRELLQSREVAERYLGIGGGSDRASSDRSTQLAERLRASCIARNEITQARDKPGHAVAIQRQTEFALIGAAHAGHVEAGRNRHARPAALPVVAIVEILGPTVVERERVIRVVLRQGLDVVARIEERARPHADARGAMAVLVDHRNRLAVAALRRLRRSRGDRRECRERHRRQDRNRHQAHDSSQIFPLGRHSIWGPVSPQGTSGTRRQFPAPCGRRRHGTPRRLSQAAGRLHSPSGGRCKTTFRGRPI